MDCVVDNAGNLLHVVDAHGRRGIGVVQPQSGLDYPFVAPSADIRYLLADLHVAVDDPSRYQQPETFFKPPFYVKYLYGAGCVDNGAPAAFLTPTHAVDILVCDAQNNTVFDSTENDATFTATTWSSNYKIIEWRSSRGSCRVILYTTWAENDPDRRHYNKYLTPQNGMLDQRAVYILPKRLKSLAVADAAGLLLPNQPEKITGKVLFKNGYNTQLSYTSTTTGILSTASVVISAAAGSGAGKYPSCTDNADSGDAPVPPITKINGVAVTATGDFLVAADGCLWAHRPTESTGETSVAAASAHLDFGAGCAPCCECQDYVDLGLQINQYRSQYANIGARVNETKQIHEQNIQKWLDQRNCGINHPLRLLMVAQRCPYMDIVCMVCNPCSECLYVSELALTLSAPSGLGASAEVVAGYTAMFAPNINGRPSPVNTDNSGGATTFRIPFPIVPAGDSAYIRFRVKLSVAAEYAVNGTLSAVTTDGEPVLTGCSSDEARSIAAASATQALYCDDNGNTNLP